MALDYSSTQALAQLYAPDVGSDDAGSPDPGTPEGLRTLVARIAELNRTGPRPVREFERAVPGAAAVVTVRVVGVADPPAGLIVLLGLGGWVAGAPGPHETTARKLAERTSCDVALIEFRRAPEHPYPAAADDIEAAVRWLCRERAVLGLGDTPMMILGEGMGAALATGTVRRALRDPDGPRFALQLLICPVVDAATDGPSGEAAGPKPDRLLSRMALHQLWSCYLPDGDLRADPDASPASATDWTGAPPTLVITAGHDVARDEGAALAARLRASGVPTAERHYEDQMHGFFSILPARMGERALQHVVRLVRGYTTRAAQGALPAPAEVGAWLERVIK